jgi:lysozyme
MRNRAEIELVYAPHDEVEDYIIKGWTFSGPLRGHHAQHACLVYRELPERKIKRPKPIVKMDRAQLADDLKLDEGVKLTPYRCTAGALTIGIGRNLDAIGITTVEAMDLLENDISRIVGELDAGFPWWNKMPEPAQRGLANMAFNLGVPRLRGFSRMLAALKDGYFDAAATEALDSQWADQVGERANRIAALFMKAEEYANG